MTVPPIPDFAAIIGAAHVLTGDAMAHYLAEERGLYQGHALAVLRPADTEQVAQVVGLAATHGLAMVPQGGNTGLCGGAVAQGNSVIISTERLCAIRAVDPVNLTMTVDAGCILANIQDAAEQAGCLFPLSLAAEGSCRIGGNLSTNAGGVGVLRYGNTRDLVLGLQVVLPDGRIWDSLRTLRKDNTGYDLKHLFIGAEGTLGIITACVLKLFPRPARMVTALAALDSPAQALALLGLARRSLGDVVTACELIPRIGLDMTVAHIPGIRDPFGAAHPWYLLLEISAFSPAQSDDVAETMLAQAMEQGIIRDVVLAQSDDQRKNLWRIRESIPEAQKYEGGSIKHDISVPVARMPDLIGQASAAVTQAMPDVRVVAFGHLGDGNVHFNLSQPKTMDKDSFLSHWKEMNRIVHDIVAEMDGSFSAEHGIGMLKISDMEYYKSEVEIDMMRRIKQVFDPHGLMNPGKVM